MADNPYSGLLGIMQEQGAKFNPPSICLGEVVSPDPDLKIKTEDLLLDKEDILVNDLLLGGYKREFQEKSKGQGTTSGTLQSSTQNTSGGGGYAEFASHNHSINNQATLTGEYDSVGDSEVTFKTYLKAGDILALLPTANRQQYIVLCKVVSL